MSASSSPLLEATTRDVEPRLQFDHFCDALCDVYLGIRPEREVSPGFDADVLAFTWGDLVLSRMRAPGHDALRDRRGISARPDDALFLNFSSTSPSIIERGGEATAVPAATPVLLDNSEPFRLRFDASRRFHLYSLRVPRDAVGHGLDATSVAEINERMRHTLLGRQITLQTRLMTAEFDGGRTEIAGAMAVVVAALFRTLCAPDQESTPGRFAQYSATAGTHLGQPAFGVRDLAAIHGVSTRTVQAVFAAEGETFTEWMLRARLEWARDRLSDPTWAGRSIEHIVHACGWGDASGFHRAFRARFGRTPASFRPLSAAAR
ncbi:AraC family transcriptional regulator [Microbacterium sp. P06]|uniref:AraC family transcriptional regulator n=1 Tax=Microbacterium sp. P06 TaxID=3366949 RepID=UPI003744B8BA